MSQSQPTPVCPVCVKLVLDSEEGIGCESKCLRWFHRDCIKMPKSEYTKFCGNKALKWSCCRADCSPEDANPLAKLSAQLAGLIQSVSHLATKDEVASINNGIDKLRESIELRLSNVEARMDDLEDKVRSLQNQNKSSGDCLEDFIGELGDRKRRACNAIVYNLPESQNKELAARINYDKGQLLELAQAIGFCLKLDEIKLFRIGRPKKNNSRSVKIVFKSEIDVGSFLRSFADANLKDGDGKFSTLSASRDRTLRERQHLNSLRTELEERMKKGEKDLTIKYRNGIPAIVAQPKND
jgi:hypothetical protein